MGHLRNHSFTGTTDHDFTGLVAHQALIYDGTNIVSTGSTGGGGTSGDLWSASTGTNSIIANNGSGNEATNNRALAGGFSTLASGDTSVSWGINTTAGGQASFAEGRDSVASGSYSHAEGQGSTASGWGSHAEGSGSTASGQGSHAEGNLTLAQGDGSHAGGQASQALSNNSFSHGYQTTATTTTDFGFDANESVALGYQTLAGGGSLVFGFGNEGTGLGTLVGGGYNGKGTFAPNTATAKNAVAFGEGTDVTGSNSLGVGSGVQVYGGTSFAAGSGAYATGTTSIALGGSLMAGGSFSFAGGKGFDSVTNRTSSKGDTSFAFFRMTSGLGDIGALADYSAILGGTDHNIAAGANSSAIFGGTANRINAGVTGSVILGGTNITGTSNNTVYVTNIDVKDGGKIRSNNGDATLDLSDQFGPNGTWSLTSDNGSYGSGSTWAYGQPGNGSQLAYQKDASETIGFAVYSSGVTEPLLATGKDIVIIDNNGGATKNSGNMDKRAIFIGTRDSDFQQGVTNSVVIGGVGLNATQDDTVYTQYFNAHTITATTMSAQTIHVANLSGFSPVNINGSMTIESSGNVAIGTTDTTNATLTIAESGTNPTVLRLKGDSVTDWTDLRMSTFGDFFIFPNGQNENNGGVGIGMGAEFFSISERLKVSGSTGIANTMTIVSGEDNAFAIGLDVDLNKANTNINQGIRIQSAQGSSNRGMYISAGLAGNTQVLNQVSNVGAISVAGENSTGTTAPSVGFVAIATRSSSEDNIGIWTSTLNPGAGNAIGLRIGYYNTTIATDFSTDANGDLTIQPSGGTGAIKVEGEFGYEFSTTATLGSNEHNFNTRGISALRVNAAAGTGTTITGFANGYDGKELVLVNVGATNFVVANQNANSTSSNRMINGNSGNDISVPTNDIVKFKYDGTSLRWRLISTTVAV